MKRARRIVGRLLDRVRRRTLDRRLEEELETHVQMLVDDYVALGLSLEEARRRARLHLGGVEQTKEAVGDQRALWFESVWQDVRHAFRALARRPSFSVAAIGTLALGIGASTAVFSVVNAVLLSALPFDRPDRIVAVRLRDTGGSEFGVAASVAHAVGRLPAVERTAIMVGVEANLIDRTGADIVRGRQVSGEFFAVFGVRALCGRPLAPRDETDGLDTVVLSERLWRSRFGGDPAIVGRAVRLDDRSYAVAGVMPATFRYPEDAEFWSIRKARPDGGEPLGRGPFDAVARLRSGNVTSASAQAGTLNAAIARDGPDRLSVALVPLLETTAGGYRPMLALLFTAVSIVLLIACGNVANLLLARSIDRTRELSVRLALGATRPRLLRELLTDCAVIAAAATAGGLALASLLLRLVPWIGAGIVPRLDEAGINWPVAVYAAATGALSIVVFGVGPAWHALRWAQVSPLRLRSLGEVHVRTTSRRLIFVEVTGTLVLVAGSLLTLTNLYRLYAVDPGFDTRGLMVATLRVPYSKYAGAARVRLNERILDSVRQTQGVTDAAMVSWAPLGRVWGAPIRVRLEDDSSPAAREETAGLRVLSPGALQVLGVRTVSGRGFTDRDVDGAPPVAIVNRALAERLWPARSPLGRTIRVSGAQRADPQVFQIVGVASDIRGSIYRQPAPEVYLSWTQRASVRMDLVVRSRLTPTAAAAGIRSAVRRAEPEAATTALATMDDLIGLATQYYRFSTALLTLFGLAALTLAATGMFAVVLHAVARRTREVGLRIALGARLGHLAGSFIRDLAPAVFAGIGAGLMGTYLCAGLARPLVFGLRQPDLGAAAAAATALCLVAALGIWWPLRRASRIDPVIALRDE